MNTDELKEKIEKLPKWAQGHIHRLEADLSRYRGEFNAAEGRKTNIIWQSHHTMENHYIPDGSEVEFTLPNGCIDIRPDSNGNLRVYANGSLKVLPQATSSVYLSIEK